MGQIAGRAGIFNGFCLGIVALILMAGGNYFSVVTLAATTARARQRSQSSRCHVLGFAGQRQGRAVADFRPRRTC
jgi:hypothetical protein